MNHGDFLAARLSFVWAVVACGWAGCGLTLFAQIPLTVVLRNGSVVTGEIASPSWNWKTTGNQNPGVPERFDLSTWQELVLARTPLLADSEKVAAALAELASPDYSTRQAAEEFLSQNPGLLVFKSLIDGVVQNSPSAEARYRANRVLQTIRGGSPALNTLDARTLHPPSTEMFDLLILRDGSRRTGDLRAEELVLQRGEQAWVIPFSQIARLRSGLLPPHAALPNRSTETTPETKVYIEEQPPEHWQHLTPLNFSQDESGSRNEVATMVSDVFQASGVIFSSTPNVQVVISDFPVDRQGEYLCTYDLTTKQRYNGIIRCYFCQPGQPANLAGVHQFGLQLRNVDNPKDFIVQAFSAEGHVIATIEASGNLVPFFGMKSQVPIAFLEISANKYLAQLTEIRNKGKKFDKNCALTNFKFSPPQSADVLLNQTQQFRFRLRSGENLLVSKWQRLTDRTWELSVEGGPTVRLGESEVVSIIGPNVQFPQPRPGSSDWFLMVADGSIVQVQPGATMTAKRFANWQLPRANWLALWTSRDYLRYPVGEDFTADGVCLVFPTARLSVPEIQWEETGLSWSRENATVRYAELDPQMSEAAHKENELAAPQFSRFSFDNPNEPQAPSVWFRPPPVRENLPGVTLRNGERWVVSEGGFQWQQVTADSISLQTPAGDTIQVGWDEVARLRW